jgi:hypothetical protein
VQNQSTPFQEILLRDVSAVLQLHGIDPSFQLKGISSESYYYLKDERTGLEVWISEEVADFRMRNTEANCELQDFDGPDHLSRYFVSNLTDALQSDLRGPS